MKSAQEIRKIAENKINGCANSNSIKAIESAAETAASFGKLHMEYTEKINLLGLSQQEINYLHSIGYKVIKDKDSDRTYHISW